MKIKDIVNRDNQTLERCDQEPIHIPGTIQPHGFLISVENDQDRTIRFCSGNVEKLVGKPLKDILGKPVKDILITESCQRLEQHLKSEQFDTSFSCVVADLEFNIAVHRVGNLFTLDLEAFPDGSISVTDQFNQTKRFLRYIQSAETFQDICQSVADETRAITGYDRVMIYRFDQDYNGEVYAESKRSDLGAFLGHHYPHTDIPAQARALYLRNLLRIITDVNYEPVPVYTIDDQSSTGPLDMSESVLRSVSPLHIEYLKNMGVGATLTISLVENKKLWGLIACHHYSPKFVPFYTRLAAQLQGHLLTSQISVRESAEENELTTTLEAKLGNLLSDISKSDNFLHDPRILSEITQVINANGVAVIRNDEIYTSGTVPTREQITELLPWLINHASDGNFVSNMFPSQYEPALKYGRDASGIIYYRLGASEKDGIIWFRSEIDKTINWAGNPTKSLAPDGMTPALTPRKSFELWQEKVRNKSKEWLAPELNVAVKLAHILQRQFHSLSFAEEEKRYIQLTQNLKKANEELANINWIGTHDLKEPLRKIQTFASKILRDESQVSPDIIDSVMRMKKSATRMQSLITDLLEYSRVNSEISLTLEKVDLNQTLKDILSELDDDIREANAKVVIDKLPVIDGIPFQLSQLFINLIDNSLKFAGKEKRPDISIACEKQTVDYSNWYVITVTDRGIGFKDVNSEKIFDVFSRHHSKEYQGTGIGLAICKKVMENHKGWIKASSNANGGASFELYFPQA